MFWNHWVIVGCAAWLVVSPWALGFSAIDLALWNNVLVGCVVALFALWNLTPPRP
jgi:hypothetical protein